MGLSNLVRITAGAVGTPLFTTSWEDRAVVDHAQLAESVNRGNSAAMQTIDQLVASGSSQQQALASVNRLIDEQACTMAVTGIFYLSAILFFALIVMVWMTRPKVGGAAGGGGAH